MFTVSHPTVNQYVRALIEALDRAKALEVFHTTVAGGRRRVNIPRQKIRQHPYRETVRLLAQRLGQERLIRHETGWASVDAVAQEFDCQVSRSLTAGGALYCYELWPPFVRPHGLV
jgi:hypothetical protein